MQAESDVSVLLHDLTKYITKIHDHPVARGGFGDMWKCIHITDHGPVTVSFQYCFYLFFESYDSTGCSEIIADVRF
jgi:hypothetical protein